MIGYIPNIPNIEYMSQRRCLMVERCLSGRSDSRFGPTRGDVGRPRGEDQSTRMRHVVHRRSGTNACFM